MTQTEVQRLLSPVERWYWIADQISPLNVIARVRLGGHISGDDLGRAAAGLSAEHPLLRVAIRAGADGTQPAFTPSTESISIGTMHGGACEWEFQVDEHELRTSLDWRSGPLVRIVDVVSHASQEAHDLVLTASHVIADGTTAMTLLRRLVEHAATKGHTVGRGPHSVPPKTCCLRVTVAPGASPGSPRPDWPMGLAQRWPGPAGSHPESMVDPAGGGPGSSGACSPRHSWTF